MEIVHEAEEILKNPKPTVFFEDFENAVLISRLYLYINKPYIEPVMQSDVQFKSDKKFLEHQVRMPFSQSDIHSYSQK